MDVKGWVGTKAKMDGGVVQKWREADVPILLEHCAGA
jgi:hypothetical protein